MAEVKAKIVKQANAREASIDASTQEMILRAQQPTLKRWFCSHKCWAIVALAYATLTAFMVWCVRIKPFTSPRFFHLSCKAPLKVYCQNIWEYNLALIRKI